MSETKRELPEEILDFIKAKAVEFRTSGPCDEDQWELALLLPDEGATTERLDLEVEIERFSETGSRAADDEDWEAAVKEWTRALEIIPNPRSEWSASTWLYTSIGDAHYQAGRIEEAGDALTAALKCPKAIGSPFLWLRIGQVLVADDNVESAVTSLLNAYMLAGAEIFNDQAPRYWQLLTEHVDLGALDSEEEE